MEIWSTQTCRVSTWTIPRSAISAPQTHRRQIKVSRRLRSGMLSCVSSSVPPHDASDSSATSAGLTSAGFIGPDIARTYVIPTLTKKIPTAIRTGWVLLGAARPAPSLMNSQRARLPRPNSIEGAPALPRGPKTRRVGTNSSSIT